MSIAKILEPEEVWDYAQEHMGEIIGVQTEIACNEEHGVSVYITSYGGNSLRVIVDVDYTQVYEEGIINDVDCLHTIEKVYNNYLTSSVYELLGNINSNSAEQNEEDEIEAREDELNTLVEDFCTGVLGWNSKYEFNEDVLEDIKEHFLEYLARKHEVPIYRPMYLEDENGEDFYEEYPYECMEFEDEDNPIYQN